MWVHDELYMVAGSSRNKELLLARSWVATQVSSKDSRRAGLCGTTPTVDFRVVCAQEEMD